MLCCSYVGERRFMRGRKKLSKRTSERKFTNSALRTKKLNISAKPRRGGIRM